MGWIIYGSALSGFFLGVVVMSLLFVCKGGDT